MAQRFKITAGDWVQQLKLSLQIPTLIESLLSRHIIAVTAQKAEIVAEPAELQQAADELRSRHNLWTAEETWAWLQQHRLSLDDLEDIAQHNVLSRKLAQHLFEGAIEPFYAEHQLDYLKVVLYEAPLENHDLALELYYAIQEQEMTFADMAHRYIQDPELRRQGGYRGIRLRDELRPEVSAAVFAAKPPQVLRPMVVQKQSYLFYVEEIIQPQLTEEVRSQILATLFDSWLKRQVSELMGQVEVGES
jgi:parvulin-like peptidyl-prolyl isomerase